MIVYATVCIDNVCQCVDDQDTRYRLRPIFFEASDRGTITNAKAVKSEQFPCLRSG